ncbi:hypothetical protein PpBr36_08264 [Pyricularia pennisetigena]|uniref:hypothetical protein n=1 Tax=Pyricularia pennisetigena TaxID=1578925 RepID=UPI00114DCD56|nr:hypothetical protein PpBr36_08264 [Pyricularia pennisetigena]TLS23967.1 hypothetical protein PpBr36_08264 [Pyricularia pennisetigena]
MPPQPHDGEDYRPQDAVKTGLRGTFVYGAFGLFGAATLAAVQRKRVGVLAPITKYGALVSATAFGGGMYDFARTATSNLRQKDDHISEAVGGLLGGAILGLAVPGPTRMPVVVGFAAGTAVTLGTYAYTGKSLRGWGKKDDVKDDFERKEELRKNRRRPIEETIAELGEGRGIHPPGYEERRRQRLKEKYGVEINPVSADPNAA